MAQELGSNTLHTVHQTSHQSTSQSFLQPSITKDRLPLRPVEPLELSQGELNTQPSYSLRLVRLRCGFIPHAAGGAIAAHVNDSHHLLLSDCPKTSSTSMSTRPTLLDFRSESHDTMKSSFTSVLGQPSPRITHFDGEIPPAMSPLDAFAAQSRLLAKQLDDSKTNGRRASRLPPLTIANSLARTGSGFMQSRSPGPPRGSPSMSPRPRDEGSSGKNTPDVEQPIFRPSSLHPRLSGLPSAETESPRPRTSPDQGRFDTPVNYQTAPPMDYFGYPRRGSPEPLQPVPTTVLPEPPVRPSPLQSQRSFDSAGRTSNPSRTQSIERSSPKPRDFSGLAPPMSPHMRQAAASIRSVPGNSSDEDLSASTGGSSFSQQRKLSSSSGMSMPQSPMPQFVQAHARSPSVNSDYSLGGSLRGRPALNFSRPISRSGRTSTEMPSRQPSFDSRPSLDSRSRQPSSDSQRILFSDDTMHTPASIDHESFHGPRDRRDGQDAPAPSYIYAKYSLPRGRMLQRESRGFDHSVIHRFEWEESPLRGTVTPATPLTDDVPISSNTSPAGGVSHVVVYTPITTEHPSVAARDRSVGHESTSAALPDDKNHASSASTRSGSTIKARSPRPPTSAGPDMNAEQHLAKAIQLHEHGSLKESTYHLRIAAKQSLPTAMLLYALACRHGWGMRPNQEEGVQWLRKAADSASLEIADDESQSREGGAGGGGDALERKTRRAQFALSIYELGVSHMNGWGIEQDKALALRCFEIAGNWGDADALAEAGFCYAQGTGCKKDLKKAAKYYRMAEAKGISMVGNSWYVFFPFSFFFSIFFFLDIKDPLLCNHSPL